MSVCPARTSTDPSLCSRRTIPSSTTVIRRTWESSMSIGSIPGSLDASGMGDEYRHGIFRTRCEVQRLHQRGRPTPAPLSCWRGAESEVGFEVRAPGSAFMDTDRACRALEACRGLPSAVLGPHSVRVFRGSPLQWCPACPACSTCRDWQGLGTGEEAQAGARRFAARPVLRQIVAPPSIFHFAGTRYLAPAPNPLAYRHPDKSDAN